MNNEIVLRTVPVGAIDPCLFSSYPWLHHLWSCSCFFGFNICTWPLYFPFGISSLLFWRFVSKRAQWLIRFFFFSSALIGCTVVTPSHHPELWSPPWGVGSAQSWEGSKDCSGCVQVFNLWLDPELQCLQEPDQELPWMKLCRSSSRKWRGWGRLRAHTMSQKCI